MFKKSIVTILALALAVSTGACSKKDSSTASLSSEADFQGEKDTNYREENPYCFLLDGVSLEEPQDVEDANFLQLFPNDEGLIEDEKMGVKFAIPADYSAYLFADVFWQYGYFIIITNPYFPQVTDHIVVSVAANCGLDWVGVSSTVDKGLTETFVKGLGDDLMNNKDFLMAHEELYCYDFIDVGTDVEQIDVEWALDLKDAVQSDNYMGHFYTKAPRTISPETSISDLTTEFVADDNNDFWVNINYHQKRYGVDMDKEVHWLARPKALTAKRIEFSTDSTATLPFDKQGFLDSFVCFVPDYWTDSIDTGLFVESTED